MGPFEIAAVQRREAVEGGGYVTVDGGSGHGGGRAAQGPLVLQGVPPCPHQRHYRVAEVSAHGAVQHEIDAIVDQRQHVHQVSERHVDVVEEVLQVDAEEDENGLRELRHHEEDDDHQQHAGGARVVRRRLARADGGCGGHPPHLLAEIGSQRGQQQPAVDDHEDAGQELGAQGIEPEVEEDDGLGVGRGQAEVFHSPHGLVGAQLLELHICV